MEIGILSLHRLRKDFLRSAQAPREFLFHTNAGLVSVQSSGAVFNANYDATANTGKLLITGAADKADTITIGGTIANGEVKVGDTFTTDSKTQAVTDTAAVALNGTTVAVSETGALKPATLTLAGGTLNVNGAVEATDTKVTGVAVLATQSGTVNQKTVYGSAKLGNVVVENAETQNTLSVSNADADNAITATSLTVKGATAAAGTAKATQGGKFTLTSGAFTAGTLSVGSGATVELTAGKFTVNGTGASTNEGTITFVNFLKTAILRAYVWVASSGFWPKLVP